MNRTRYLILQMFLFAVIVIFALEYTLPTAKNILGPSDVVSVPTDWWEKIASYEKVIAILGNIFCIIGPFVGVLLSYLISRLSKKAEG